MSTVSAVRIVNINTVTYGNTIVGAREVQIEVDKGEHVPILKEGLLYPSGIENLGTRDCPVRGRVSWEQSTTNALALLNLTPANLAIAVKTAGGGTQTITIANVRFTRLTTMLNLQRFSVPALEFVAYSTAGTALPISAA
jgi:hypothetical protein